MKAVLVKDTKISFSIDKELITDETPSRDKFHYSKGIIDFMQNNFSERKKIIAKDFHANLDLNYKEKCEIHIQMLK